VKRKKKQEKRVRVCVDVVNAGTLVSDRDARRAVAALRTQLRDHFAPAWGKGADLRYVARGAKPRAEAWQLVLLDQRDANYGFHELTRTGLPLGKVFVREANQTRLGWTCTASHELLELLVNPDTTFGVLVEDRSLGPRIYSYEVCDPVQDDRFGYEIDGVPVSDFVYPAWFEPWRGRGTVRFDHAEKLRSPFQVPSACYAMFYDIEKRIWLDNWGGKVTPHLLVPAGESDRLRPDRGGSRARLIGSPSMLTRHAWRKSAR
jgi:hypothetical protein